MNKQSMNKNFLNQYHEYIVNTNKWNDNVIEYLQGHDKNLYGTILGFKRGWRKNNKDADFDAFLLFFDHTTARIERYLINLGIKKDIEVVKINEDVDPKEHIDFWEEERQKVIRPVYNSPYNIPNTVLIHNLHDGKLNKHFFSVFVTELFRDYLIGGPSYNNPNISNILRFTQPNHILEQDKDGGIQTGSGDLSYYNMSSASELSPQHELFSFKRKQIINCEGEHRKIMIPEIFNSKEINTLIKNYNFKLEVFNPKDQPLVIKDIKAITNSRVYTNIDNINKGIVDLNHTLAKKVHDINENVKKPTKPPINRQLFLHNMMRKI